MFAENKTALKVKYTRTNNLVGYKPPPEVTVFKIKFFLSIIFFVIYRIKKIKTCVYIYKIMLKVRPQI